MENQHKLIKGYRDLTQEEIDLINEIKETGNSLGDLIEKVEDIAFHGCEGEELSKSINSVCNAEDYLKTGIMWLTRAVAKPDGF